MARFLSAAWADEFNAALEGVALPGPDPEAGLAAADGNFAVAEEVRGTPDGDVVLVLVAEGEHLTLEVMPMGPEPDGRARQVGVTLALSYEDAVALSTGDLSVADALNEGRVKVRGDLSVLVAGQRLLDAAQRAVADRLTTTY